MIIGIAGFIGSGKDTLADYLVNFHQFRRDSFAAPLKDAAAVIFGWDREMLEGRTKQARIKREEVDTWWAEKLNIPNFSPRMALQLLGTEAMRNVFSDDIWTASLERRMRETMDDTVISDCRFANEMSAIKNSGGIVVRITRGPNPDWYSIAETANQHVWDNKPVSAASIEAKKQLEALGIHASEHSWIGAPFDAVIDNNGEISDLYNQIKKLLPSAGMQATR
jgi:uridine kinase